MKQLSTICGYILLIIFIFGCANRPDTLQFFYTDQNNNTYTITSVEVWYDPITPNESSSGVYSGGEKAVVPISEKTYLEIVQLAEDLQKDSLNHLGRREMLTAILLTEKNGEDISRVILSPSKNRTSLEELLIGLIK